MENNNDILNKINSGEPEVIAEAVKEIKENGDLSIAEALIRNLQNIREAHTVTVVVNLLADIKDNNFREILIKEIQSATSSDIKIELLRIVWESSLDYSAYLNVFLELLRHCDFAIAFEASTVIENMVHHLNEEQKSKLHEVITAFPTDKQYLIANIHAEIECSGKD